LAQINQKFDNLKFIIKRNDMPSKFFGNRFDKQANNKGKNPNQKSSKNKATNQNNKSKSGGVRKVGRGG